MSYHRITSVILGVYSGYAPANSASTWCTASLKGRLDSWMFLFPLKLLAVYPRFDRLLLIPVARVTHHNRWLERNMYISDAALESALECARMKELYPGTCWKPQNY